MRNLRGLCLFPDWEDKQLISLGPSWECNHLLLHCPSGCCPETSLF